MHFFHSRPSYSQSSAPEPRSTWARAHAIEVSQWREDFKIISDSRTCLVDIGALQVAVEAATGQRCIAIEWVAEGGSNQLYLISLEDGAEIIARIKFPFPHRVRTGKEFTFQEANDRARIPYRVQSEVATIHYLQEHTNIPVAKIYAYDSSLTSLIGSPYTLQQVLQGDLLSLRWNTMGPSQRVAIIKSLGRIVGQMMSLVFNQYGSLRPNGISQSRVGPLVEPIKSLHRDHALQNAGPWSATEQPFSPILALAKRELGWLKSKAGSKLFTTWRNKVYPSENCVKTLPAFIRMEETLIIIIPHIYSLFPLPKEAWRPVLSHADFHFGNILVSREDPTVVTGVIDWEFAAILPLWAAYRVPPVIADRGDVYETNERLRKAKAELRQVFGNAVGKDAQILLDNDQSVRGLRLLDAVSTMGLALYASFDKVKAQLIEIRRCVGSGTITDQVKILDDLIIHFSELDYT